jgi:hypothetical protein
MVHICYIYIYIHMCIYIYLNIFINIYVFLMCRVGFCTGEPAGQE